eukprot:1160228-Pelagomonas_calceolata.AAC.7
MGIWRVIGSTWLQNLAVRSITVFHSTSGGFKLQASIMPISRHQSLRVTRPGVESPTSEQT